MVIQSFGVCPQINCTRHQKLTTRHSKRQIKCLFLWISQNNSFSHQGMLRIEFTSLIAKSTSISLSDKHWRLSSKWSLEFWLHMGWTMYFLWWQAHVKFGAKENWCKIQQRTLGWFLTDWLFFSVGVQPPVNNNFEREICP